ncbi:MAG: ATPase, T2SS/T4P/T4SS family [Vulcanimicrobiota bacterium]
MLDDLTQTLLADRLLTEGQLLRAQEQALRSACALQKVIVELGFVTEKELVEAMGRRLGVGFVDLDSLTLDSELARLVPEHLAKRYQVFPVSQSGNRLTLAMADPMNVIAVDDIRLVTGFEIETLIAPEAAIERTLGKVYGSTDLATTFEDEVKGLSGTDVQKIFGEQESEEEISLEDLQKRMEEAPIVRMVNLIISQAIVDKASDIHIEPEARAVRVRYRVDGVLHEVMTTPKHIQAPMVSRLKIMASMDIAERRVPLDGKIHLTHEGKEYDLRVSTIPTVHGEKTVMRILDKNSVQLGLNKLGFQQENLLLWESLVEKPYGMLLVTGPTGSGKSTTLYSCLNKLNQGERNLTTVEDPVEYQIAGINQVQTNNKAGLNFATALRSFLRQDPDILMVGEIRDGETAKIAVEAALTGHLVLSTLHTNDACGAISRLTEMGVEPFLVSSALVGVLAQRLARQICPNCKESYRPLPDSLRKLGLTVYAENDINFYRGRGCEHCKTTGYRGRSGIHEILTITDRVRGLILNNASSAELRQAAIEDGMRTMQYDAIQKVLSGATSLEECLRVIAVEGSE